METEAGLPDEEEVPDTLSPQVPVIEEVLDALGIARVGVEGYEADDVIGTFTGRADGPVDIVTGDRDLYQLVDDKRACVLHPSRAWARSSSPTRAGCARSTGSALPDTRISRCRAATRATVCRALGIGE